MKRLRHLERKESYLLMFLDTREEEEILNLWIY